MVKFLDLSKSLWKDIFLCGLEEDSFLPGSQRAAAIRRGWKTFSFTDTFCSGTRLKCSSEARSGASVALNLEGEIRFCPIVTFRQ